VTKIVEQTFKYQKSCYGFTQKRLKKHHQITRISNHLAKPTQQLKKTYLKKVSREFLESGEKIKNIWSKVDSMKIKEVVNIILKIAHDGSDIAKPYGRKMEGREIVRDGSASSKRKCVTVP